MLPGIIAVLVSVALAAVAVWGVRQIYFVGTDSGGRVALYRGLPYELPFGLKLYTEEYAAPVQVGDLPKSDHGEATDHTLRFHDDAVSIVKHLTVAARPPKPVRVPPHPKPKPAQKQPQQGQKQQPAKKQAKPSQGGGGKP
jgi:hypothetical protein